MDAQSVLSPQSELMEFNDDLYILEEIKNNIKENKYDFVIIDFIQNVVTKERDEYSAMSLISLELQRLAKQCNCCIVVLSQLSNMANRGGYIEYKGSGGIAMVADLGFFILRPPIEDEDKTKFTLALRKNRRGISGLCYDLKFKTPGGLIE
jgi:replicative DNA helicase